MDIQNVDHVIVGSGFTGLINAYYSIKNGEKVAILEKGIRTGGSLNSIQTEYGLVESAANGILSSYYLDDILSDIGLNYVETLENSKRRYIYCKNKPTTMPLNLIHILRFLYGFMFKKNSFLPQESVSNWSNRILGNGFTKNFIDPALTGIYASDIDTMSAELLFSKYVVPDKTLFKSFLIFRKKNKGKKKKTTISFKNGMGEMISLLTHFVNEKAQIFYNSEVSSYDELVKRFPNKKITLCIGLKSLFSFLKNEFKDIEKYQSKIQTLSLLSATRFGSDNLLKKNGFGVLFPKNSPVRARGILFNHNLFSDRIKSHVISSETYIYGGSFDPKVIDCSKEEILDIIEADRKKINPKSSSPIDVYVSSWMDILPVYSSSLLDFNLYLDKVLPDNVRIEGNFRYGIGLSYILERAHNHYLSLKT